MRVTITRRDTADTPITVEVLQSIHELLSFGAGVVKTFVTYSLEAVTVCVISTDILHTQYELVSVLSSTSEVGNNCGVPRAML